MNDDVAIEAGAEKPFFLGYAEKSRAYMNTTVDGVPVFDVAQTHPGKRRGVKVMIGMPVYGGYCPAFVHCMFELLVRAPFEMVLRPVVGESLISRARNRIAADFLKSDCTHLLFLDTDLIFSVDHLKRLLSHDKPLVAGLYPKKQRELAWVCNLLETEEPTGADGLVRVRYAGTGCLCIRRDVLERLAEARPDLRYGPDSGEPEMAMWDFFTVGVHEGKDGVRRLLSEDWYFCQHWLDLGGDVWMDTQVVLKHVGQAVYPLEVPDGLGG